MDWKHPWTSALLLILVGCGKNEPAAPTPMEAKQLAPPPQSSIKQTSGKIEGKYVAEIRANPGADGSELKVQNEMLNLGGEKRIDLAADGTFTMLLGSLDASGRWRIDNEKVTLDPEVLGGLKVIDMKKTSTDAVKRALDQVRPYVILQVEEGGEVLAPVAPSSDASGQSAPNAMVFRKRR